MLVFVFRIRHRFLGHDKTYRFELFVRRQAVTAGLVVGRAAKKTRSGWRVTPLLTNAVSFPARTSIAQVFHGVLGPLCAAVVRPGRRIHRDPIGHVKLTRSQSARRERHVPNEARAEKVDGLRLGAIFHGRHNIQPDDVRTRSALHTGPTRPCVNVRLLANKLVSFVFNFHNIRPQIAKIKKTKFQSRDTRYLAA